MEEERLATIDHDNRLLLKKMMHIMEKGGKLDNRNDYKARSLNQPYKQRQADRIEQENLEIARRLEQVKPIYRTEKWEEDHKRHQYYLELWAKETKDYTPRGTERRKREEEKDEKKGDEYESDFESDDEDKKGEKGDKGEKLPPIEQEKQEKREDSDRPKSGSSGEKLPKIKNKKENEKEKQKNHQAETDAKHLFRVAKALSPPHDIFIRTLVRRTPNQRQQIKQKFKELYDLDLQSELKQGLDKDWHLLIDALLSEEKDDDDKDKDSSRKSSSDRSRGRGHGKGHGKRHGSGRGRGGSRSSDRGGPEVALHEALEKGDIPSVVQQLADLSESQLSKLKEDYKKEYVIGLEAAIKDRTKDPEQLLLLTLLKEKKDDGEKKDAHADATAIYESGEGRWSTPSGVFIKLLEERNTKHMRGVLLKYHQVSDGTSAVKAVEKECSKEYAAAIQAFLNKGKGKGKGRGKGSAGSRNDEDDEKAKECAILLYKSMHPNNETFVKTLVERAEIDMPNVRKAYWKKYKSELHTDLDQRSRHTTVNVLIELILKTPPSKDKSKGHDKDKDGKGRHGNEGQKKGHQKHHDQQQQHQDNRHRGQGQKKGHDKDGDEQQQQQSDRSKGRGQGQNKGQGQKKGHDKKQDGGEQKKDSPFGQSSKRGMAEARETKKKEEEDKAKEGDAKKKKKQDEDADVERLHKAMDGLGTDEDTILDIIISKTNAQRQSLKKKYKEKYKKELADDLKSELSGDFEEVMLGLLMPPVEYDAHCLHSAVKGLGTNEDVLIGIMCTANPKELSKMKEQYKKAYGEDLDKALKGDTSGGFADLLMSLSEGQRDQGSSVNEKEAKEDAKKLYRGGKGLDINDQTFKDLMGKKNKAQVQATDKEYKKLSGMTLEEAIKKAASGDAEDGYLGLLSAMDDPVTFYADSLQKAFKGLGTNDSQLIRIVVSRSEVDLPAIKAKFQERHGRSLRAAIEDETSGDYRKALLKLVDKK
nr:hypothetical protein BaRGS_023939 [Batillaria attramentaria]